MSVEKNDIIIYQSESGTASLDVHLEHDTVWLTQAQLAELFSVKVPAINKHLKNIFSACELIETAVISILETTAADGKSYRTRYYNLDAIIAVGYPDRRWIAATAREH